MEDRREKNNTGRAVIIAVAAVVIALLLLKQYTAEAGMTGKTAGDHLLTTENDAADDASDPKPEENAYDDGGAGPEIQPPAEAAPKEHEHIWTDVIETVHHDAGVIHHEAEYTVIHHDAETLHHDAEYTSIHHDAYTVHHDETGHYEEHVVKPAYTEKVLVKEAWDEEKEITKTEQHTFCSACDLDMTVSGLSREEKNRHEYEHAIRGEPSGEYSVSITVSAGTETVHHEAEYKEVFHEAVTENAWITDSPAYDETVPGWDEQVLVRDAYDEVIRPAWDEKAVIREAFDEVIPPYDEEVAAGQRCSICGASR